MRAMEAAGAPAACRAAPACNVVPPLTPVVAAAAEQRTYDAALEQFKRADYAGAVTSFTGFVRTYPQSALAPVRRSTGSAMRSSRARTIARRSRRSAR
jgi:TolA-binding protein